MPTAHSSQSVGLLQGSVDSAKRAHEGTRSTAVALALYIEPENLIFSNGNPRRELDEALGI